MKANDIKNLVDNAETQAEFLEAARELAADMAEQVRAFVAAAVENPYVSVDASAATALLDLVQDSYLHA
jgi:hypothetical protein